MTKVQLSLFLLAALCCQMASPASAVIHIVGGSLGWSIPPNATYFQDWAKSRVFGVNDRLFFPFRSDLHTVQEVSKDDFDKCTQNSVISTHSTGPLTLTFTKPGDYYYYSAVGIQCEAGQKLHITVVPGNGSTGRTVPSANSTKQHLHSHPHPHHHHHIHTRKCVGNC
ncbi:hypothetical protein ACSBR2_038178 [Camellia fascicularis]